MSNTKKILWARGTSEVGNAIRQAILALAILGINNNPQNLFTAEVLETIGVLTMMLLGPLFIDRVNRKKSLVFADLFCVANSLFLFWGATIESLPIMLIGSYFTTFFSSFYRSSLNALASEGGEGKIDNVRYGLGMIQISILIGALVGLIGTSVAIPRLPLQYFFLIDAMTFIVSSSIIFGIKTKDPSPLEKLTKPWNDWLEGFTSSWSDKSVKAIMISGIFGGIAYGIFESSSVVHLKEVVQLSDSWVTASRAFNRLGAIAAILFMFWIGKRNSKFSGNFWIFVGGGMTFASFFLMSFSSPITYLAAGAIMVAGMSIINPALSAVIGSTISPKVLGRVFTFYSLATYIGVLVGNVFMAIGGVNLGTPSCLIIAGLVYLGRFGFGLKGNNSAPLNKPTSSS